MKIYSSGTVLKRINPDYGEVEILKADENHTMLRDSNGTHFVSTSDIEEYFKLVKPEDLLSSKNIDHFDNPKKHNVAFGMNQPSETQKKAFNIKEGKC